MEWNNNARKYSILSLSAFLIIFVGLTYANAFGVTTLKNPLFGIGFGILYALGIIVVSDSY